MIYRENASLIVKDRFEDTFLIVKKPREKDAWQFPQGGVDEGETLLQTARREFIEECGNSDFEIQEKVPGIFKYEWSEEMQKERNFLGQNVHFFLGYFTKKNPEIRVDRKEVIDFYFAKKEELANFFDRKEYLDFLQEIPILKLN